MKLENQVCNLKLAKKLKELGVKQDSLFYWVIYSGSYLGSHEYVIRSSEDIKKYKYLIIEKYSAYTVAELGELLPKDCYSTKRKLRGWECHYIYPTDGEGDDIYTLTAKIEADARAKMLIYLLENKLIKGV